LPPSAAEFYIETTLDSLILLRKINESSVVSNYYLAQSAKLYLYGDIFFLILLRKIKKKMSPYKEYFAAAGGEIFFPQDSFMRQL
jgi:hypothetical protein